MNNETNKRLSKISLILRISIVILCSLFIFTRKIDSSLAKYTSKVSATDSARVATIYVGANLSQPTIEIPLSNEPITYELIIQNYDESKHSEVTYEYGFTVSTLGNLPIDITIEQKTNNGKGTLATINNLEATEGIMLCDGDIQHKYTITIKWTDDVLDYEDTLEIDILKISYYCEQIMPEEVSD